MNAEKRAPEPASAHTTATSTDHTISAASWLDTHYLALWVLERFVEELAQVRASLGLRQIHLFGPSWGTMLATEYALHQPAGLASLVLSGKAALIADWA